MALLGGATVGLTANRARAQNVSLTSPPTIPGGSSGQLQYNNSGVFGGYGIGSGLSVVSGNLTATGGGGGLAVAASITALTTTSSSAGTVLLTQNGLVGLFNWNSADQSAAVTSDLTQAITVAPFSDPTGASGAWIRQYAGQVNFSWFGLISGPFTDAPTIAANSTALTGWATWARNQSSLGFGIDMFVSPGTYPFDMALTGHWSAGVRLLHTSGYESTWQNVTTNPSWPLPWPLAWPGFLGNNSSPSGGRYLINSTTVGSLAITSVTPADITNLTPGDYALLTSLDQEYTGYPPNPAQFEFPVITLANQYAAASPTSATYTTGTGLLALPFATPPLVAVTLAAAASFTAGVSTITMSSVAGIITGMNVFDNTNSQQIGTVTSIDGNIVGLFQNAAHASAGTNDSLIFTANLNGALVTVSGITGGAVNGTWPIQGISTNGLTVTLQLPTGLGSLTLSGGTLAATGVATLDRPIRWAHRSDYPDNPTNPNPAGAARVSILKNNGGAGSILWDWNTKQIYEGLTVLEPTIRTNGQGYISMSGKHNEWHNSTIPGISPTVTELCKVVGSKFYLPSGSQPDKMIDTCILEGNEIQGGIAFTGATNNMIATGNLIGGLFNAGAKNNVLNGNDIGSLGFSASNGASRSCIINGGRINAYTPPDHFGSGAAFTASVGGPVLYSNGVFSIPWTQLTPLLPGMMLHWASSSGNLYTGDSGSMLVTSISGDSTYLYAQTTCQSPGIPSFSSGQVFVRRWQRLIANGVSGCDSIRRASAATAAGFPEWGYISEQLIGANSPANHDKAIGYPQRFSVNVRQPCAVSGKTLTVTLSLFSASAPTTSENLVWTIDLSTIGERILSQTGSVLLFGADTLTFNGTIAAAFPNGWFLNGGTWPLWALNYAPSSLTLLQLPWVEMRMQFDPGMFFTILTAQLDQTNLDTLIGSVQGAIL